jgi:hypothetical protein
VSEVRVIPAVDMPEPPVPVARRKGQAGAWQVLHEGKWISERAVKAHEALLSTGGARHLAAVQAGLTNDEFRRAIDVYDKATAGKARTPAASAKTERPRLVKPTPEVYYAPKPAPSEPEPAVEPAASGPPVDPEPVAVFTVSQSVSSSADAKVVLKPPLDGDLLSHQAYRHGYLIGWMAAALAAAVDTASNHQELRQRIARLALDPPEPPRLPR